MHRRLLLPLLAVSVLAAAPSAASADELKASNGTVAAVVSWTPKSDFEYRDLKLTVTRAGVVAWDKPLSVKGCKRPFCKPGDVQVVDLDANGEPEVLVDVFSGGAHCCDIVQLLTFADGAYTATQRNFADPGYSIDDVDADGRPELVSADARFAYAFASFAATGMPIQIFRVEGGKFVDVTAAHTDLVRKDAEFFHRQWRRNRGKRTMEPLGALAAWVADMELLGEGDKAEAELKTALRRGWLKTLRGWSSGRKFLRELDVFLRRTGYRR